MDQGVCYFCAGGLGLAGFDGFGSLTVTFGLTPLLAPSSSLSIIVVVAFLVGASAVVFRQGRHRELVANLRSHPPRVVDDRVTRTSRDQFVSEAPVSDEETVEDLLANRGGRLRQTAIVEGTGWSKSKVSVLLSDMEDEGRVQKLRVGRENIVSLPGFEPDAVRRRETD